MAHDTVVFTDDVVVNMRGVYSTEHQLCTDDGHQCQAKSQLTTVMHDCNASNGD